MRREGFRWDMSVVPYFVLPYVLVVAKLLSSVTCQHEDFIPATRYSPRFVEQIVDRFFHLLSQHPSDPRRETFMVRVSWRWLSGITHGHPTRYDGSISSRVTES